jgi:hypothetical protein
MTLKVIPPKAAGRYALLVQYKDNRAAFFKTYDDLGSAKNVFHHKTWGFEKAHILENVEGDWYALHTMLPTDEHKPWESESSSWSYSYMRWRAKPMTRDEYAKWRVAVERERLEEKYAKERAFLSARPNTLTQ